MTHGAETLSKLDEERFMERHLSLDPGDQGKLSFPDDINVPTSCHSCICP